MPDRIDCTCGAIIAGTEDEPVSSTVERGCDVCSAAAAAEAAATATDAARTADGTAATLTP